MRTLAILTGAAALAIGVSAANAAETVGTIETIDLSIGGAITLSNGDTYFLSPSIDPAELKVGQKVMVVFAEPYGKLTANAVVPTS